MGAKMMHKLLKWLVLFGCFAVIGSASALATNPHTASAREQTRIMSYNNYFEE